MAKAGIDFRYQRPPNKIYRVGPTIGTQPDCEYTSIQTAINQALADGHNLSNPATVEIYYAQGGYTEDLTIYTGISLLGIALNNSGQFGRVYPTVNGTATWTPVAGNRNSNQAYIEGLNIAGKNGADTFTFAGTVGAQLNLINANIAKNNSDGFIAFRKTNTQGSGGGSNRAQVNLYNSTIYMNDTVTTNISAIVMQNGGQFRMNGTESYLEFEGNQLNTSVIDLQGNAQLQVKKGLIDGEATTMIKISGAGVFCSLEFATVGPYGSNATTIFEYVAAGAVSCNYSLLQLGNTNNTLASGAANGSLVLAFCAFNSSNSGTSFGGAQGINSVPATLNVEVRAEGSRVARNDGSLTAYVGYDNGFPSIQSAWDFLKDAGTYNGVILLNANATFVENLNLTYGTGDNTVIKGDFPLPAIKNVFGPSYNGIPIIQGQITTNGGNVTLNNIRLEGSAGGHSITQAGNNGGKLQLIDCELENINNDGFSLIKQSYTVVRQDLDIVNCDMVYQSVLGIGIDINSINPLDIARVSILDCRYVGAFNATTANPRAATNMTMISSNADFRSYNTNYRGSPNTFFNLYGATIFPVFEKCFFEVDVRNGTGFFFTDNLALANYNNTIEFGNSQGTLIARDGVAAKAVIAQTSNAYLNNDGYNVKGGYGGAILKSGIDFAIGATAADTALNIADAINTSINVNIDDIVYSYPYGDDINIYPWNWTTAANAFEIFPYGHSFITLGIGSFYKVVGAGRAWQTKDINGNDDYFWYRCADATVKINNTGAFFDVVGAGKAWTAKDAGGADFYFWYLNGSADVTINNNAGFFDVVGAAKAWTAKDSTGADHYFWYNVVGGSNIQTDPGLAGTGHQINILAADLAANIATATNTVVDALAEFNSTVVGATVTVENSGLANAAAATSGATVTNSNQTDPGLTGTGNVVGVFSTDTASDVAFKTNAVVNALAQFESSVVTDTITVENGGFADAADVDSNATIIDNNQTDPGLAGTGHVVNLYSSDTDSGVATKTNTVINTLVGFYTSTVITNTVNLVNDGEAVSVDVNAATISNSNPPAVITPWSGGANGLGGSFQYGSCVFPSEDRAQSTITRIKRSETLAAY